MVRNNPTVKVARVKHMMLMTGVEIIFSSLLCDILEGAIARGGAQDVEMGFSVEGGFVLFPLTYPFYQNMKYKVIKQL